MRNLFIALLIVPLVELAAFLLSGKLIGIPETLILVVVTSLLGAFILKKEGVKAIRSVQEQLSLGSLPGDAILNGFCVLIGGIFMLLPGFLSDIVGALLLLPPESFAKSCCFIICRKNCCKRTGLLSINRHNKTAAWIIHGRCFVIFLLL